MFVATLMTKFLKSYSVRVSLYDASASPYYRTLSCYVARYAMLWWSSNLAQLSDPPLLSLCACWPYSYSFYLL